MSNHDLPTPTPEATTPTPSPVAETRTNLSSAQLLPREALALAYSIGLLDPRVGPDEAPNSELLGPTTLGIEVTVPRLAAACGRGNVDPQHAGAGSTDLAAIDLAPTMELPPADTRLVTIRPDLDAFGAMAILSLRAQGAELSDALLARAARISQSDRFDRGGWPGPRPLPTRESVAAVTDDEQSLQAIGTIPARHGVPVATRVAQVQRWLTAGEEPAGARAQVASERLDEVAALERGEIRLTPFADGRAVLVVSAHRSAMALGYRVAPVVVAVNPTFTLRGSAPHRKLTIAQFTPGFIDLAAVRDALNALQPGHGGSPTIIGSPQGIESEVDPEALCAIVTAQLKN